MKEENKKYRVAAKEAIKEIMTGKWSDWNTNEQEAFNDMLKGCNVRWNVCRLAPKTLEKYYNQLEPEDMSDKEKLDRLFYMYIVKQIRKMINIPVE